MNQVEFRENHAPIISMKSWVLTTILLAIPLVNIIMLFVWAFDGSTNPNKKNYARASLLIGAIVLALYLVFLFAIIMPLIKNSLGQ